MSPQVRANATTRGFSGGALADIKVFSTHAEIGDDTIDLPGTFTPGGYLNAADGYDAGRTTRNVRAVTRAFIDHDATVTAGITHLDADSDAQTHAVIESVGIVVLAISAWVIARTPQTA